MKIVSGRTGSPHVTSQQFRQMLEGIIGQGSYIITSGENLKPELSSNNLLKIRSGMMAHHGCISCVDIGTYDEVALTNGSQGMKRIDLIVNRYTRNAETEVENCSWKVIQGKPVASNPAVPAYTSGNLQNGDLVDECPAFEVHYDGINVTEVKSLLSVTDGLSELSSKLTNTNTKLYETYVDPSTKSICIRFPINRIQICAGTIRVYASLQQNGTGYTGVSTKIEQSTFPKPFKILRGCTITQNSDDWVMILGKTTTLNGISQLRLGYFTAYTNKAFYMDYIAIGTY